MAKHRITQQQMLNLQAALAAWAKIPVETVDLSYWRTAGHETAPTCGSLACFGGWLPYIPHFKALGVVSGEGGRPELQGAEYHLASHTLFGWSLFGSAGEGIYAHPLPGQTIDWETAPLEWNPSDLSDIDEVPATHHQIVTARLEHAIEYSEVQA